MHPEILHLRQLATVREKCTLVYDLAMSNQLKYFDYDVFALPPIITFICTLIERDYPSIKDVPPHGRWRQYETGGKDRIYELIESWKGVDSNEKTRRLLDLITVSVLLDAGAGEAWHYKENKDAEAIGRSEGLALAALAMFRAGAFSSVPGNPYQADGIFCS